MASVIQAFYLSRYYVMVIFGTDKRGPLCSFVCWFPQGSISLRACVINDICLLMMLSVQCIPGYTCTQHIILC